MQKIPFHLANGHEDFLTDGTHSDWFNLMSCELGSIETNPLTGSPQHREYVAVPLMAVQMLDVAVSLRRRIHAQKGGTPPLPKAKPHQKPRGRAWRLLIPRPTSSWKIPKSTENPPKREPPADPRSHPTLLPHLEPFLPARQNQTSRHTRTWSAGAQGKYGCSNWPEHSFAIV